MNEQAVHKEHKLKDGHILQIFQDTWTESPRSWDNLGTMAIFHKRYNFGDEVDFASDDFGNWSEMQEHIINNLKAAVCLPIYMYDHSGITINTQGFACPWDSGQVGFIYVTADDLKAEGITEEEGKQILEQEVWTMDTYITGNVYGFHLIKDGETKDSCSGFYGENTSSNGMLDHIPTELIPEDLTL
jgi:hypothetical protein